MQSQKNSFHNIIINIIISGGSICQQFGMMMTMSDDESEMVWKLQKVGYPCVSIISFILILRKLFYRLYFFLFFLSPIQM